LVLDEIVVGDLEEDWENPQTVNKEIVIGDFFES